MSAAPSDIIGLAADPTKHVISSRNLQRTVKRMHQRRAAEVAAAPAAAAVPAVPDFETRIDDDRRQMFRRAWNKLEADLKWQKLLDFCNAFAESNRLTPKETGMIADYMRRALDAKLLNTKNAIHYDQEAERIVTVYGLHELPRNATNDRRFGLAKPGRAVTRRKRSAEPPVAQPQGPVAVAPAPVTTGQTPTPTHSATNDAISSGGGSMPPNSA